MKDINFRRAYLAMAEKLVPVGLLEWLATKIFALDGFDPHVIVPRVNHKVEHAGLKISALTLFCRERLMSLTDSSRGSPTS